MIRSIHKSKAQSLVEYSVLVIIVLAALLAMKDYVAHGIQGRQKSAIDEMGDQYDPRTANSVMNYVLSSSSNTAIDVVPAAGGRLNTRRVDTSNSTERKIGTTSVGPN